MPAPFCFIELNTQDVAKAKSFYTGLLHWEMEPMPHMPDYTMIKTAPGGGIMQHPMPGAPSFWLPYVEVDDIQASTQKAVELGAKLIRDVMPVSEMGWLSIFTDPTGATLGLWQTKKQ